MLFLIEHHVYRLGESLIVVWAEMVYLPGVGDEISKNGLAIIIGKGLSGLLGEGRRSNQFNRLIGQAQTLAVEKEDGDADKLVIVGFGKEPKWGIGSKNNDLRAINRL